MTSTVGRRRVLASVGAGLAGFAGCATGRPGSGAGPTRTIYVGAYHWGFVLFDGSGAELERVVLERGETVRLVAFNTSASRAVASLPRAVREALPDHESLEARNAERIPVPAGTTLHDRLETANEQYPDHSLSVVPSGQVSMHGGMVLRPVPLNHDASRPVSGPLTIGRQGDYTVSCVTYCGYGHAFMERDGVLAVV